MSSAKIIAGLSVNLLLPLLGVGLFAWLCRCMRKANIPSPPYYSYFILFITFGGWLMVIFTALFWEWSGMASLGFVYLVFVAPLVTAGVAYNLYNRRALSPFHRNAYFASIAYSGLLILAFVVWLGARCLTPDRL